MKSRVLWFLIVALAAVLWIACSGDDDPMAPPAGPTTVPDSVSFKNHIQPIFSARCAVSGCHVAPNPRAGSVLVLDPDRVEEVPLTLLAAVRSLRALGRGIGSALKAPRAS